MYQTTALIQIKNQQHKISFIGSLNDLKSEVYNIFGKVEFRLIKTKTIKIK